MWSRTATEADLDGLGGDVHLAASADEAAEGADVVLLCTSAAAPVVDARRLAPGSLITSVSTNAPMAHEIDPAVLGNLDVYADYAPAAFAAGGEMRLAAAEHGFTLTDIRGDLDLLAGAAPAPTGARPVFFRSVGLGIEDAAVALAALQILETLIVKIAPFGVELWMNEYETRSTEGTERLRSAVAALYERQGTGNVLIAQATNLRTQARTYPSSQPEPFPTWRAV